MQSIAAAVQDQFGPPPDDEIWIGDDTALVSVPAAVLLATDAAVAGVHADLGLVGLDDLGWKAVAGTVSDIAAMGGRPIRAVVALCAPPGTDLGLCNRGIVDAASTWDCPLVGGDLSTAPAATVVVTVLGSLGDDPAPAVRRSGARPGDTLLVTGPTGASAGGLRLLRDRRGRGAGLGTASRSAGGSPVAEEALVAAHRRPQARVEEGWAARTSGVRALIDVSDGLSIDLHRLCAASGVGAALDEVPVAPGASEEEALAGGEDYELLMAVAPGGVARLRTAFDARGLRPPLDIGRCTREAGVVTLGGATLAPQGWEHRFG